MIPRQKVIPSPQFSEVIAAETLTLATQPSKPSSISIDSSLSVVANALLEQLQLSEDLGMNSRLLRRKRAAIGLKKIDSRR